MSSVAERQWAGLPANTPAQTGVPVVTNDSTSMDVPCRALYVGGAGNVTVLTLLNDVVTFTGVQAGATLPVAVRRVNATGTSATNMVALY